MSKYNEYAKRLDRAFVEAREKYEVTLRYFEAAKKNYESAKRWQPETYIGENESRKIIAKAYFDEATARMDDAKRTIWPEFEREAKRIGQELETAVKADNVASPDSVDTNGLELLKSGIMGADDYEAMLQRYDENPTMLRLMSKYAFEAADSKLPNDDRAVLYRVANEARNGRNATLRSWDNLVGIAMTCSGIQSIGKSYIPQMGAYWDEASSGIVEEF